MGSMPTTSEQPLRCLDLDAFVKGNAAEQQKFCNDLHDSFCSSGFVKLVGHSFDLKDIEQVFDWGVKFFALPEEAKAKAAHPAQPNPHRGYSYVGQEKLSHVRDFEKGHVEDTAVLDIKESFDQGDSRDTLYPNRWPQEEDLPGFRTFMENFYERCHEVHMLLLRAISLSLGLEATHLQALCDDNNSELRLNHYPEFDLEASNKGAKRISEHTDFGTITLLFQDSIGGLEIEDQAKLGHYLPVPLNDRVEMIINIGDCLQRWTNDKFRSASHRVVLPPGAVRAGDRYSVAYFAKPNREQLVGALPEFAIRDAAPKYAQISAWEYNQQKLLRTYY